MNKISAFKDAYNSPCSQFQTDAVNLRMRILLVSVIVSIKGLKNRSQECRHRWWQALLGSWVYDSQTRNPSLLQTSLQATASVPDLERLSVWTKKLQNRCYIKAERHFGLSLLVPVASVPSQPPCKTCTCPDCQGCFWYSQHLLPFTFVLVFQ